MFWKTAIGGSGLPASDTTRSEAGGVLKKEEIAKPRRVGHAQGTFAVGDPEISRYANHFFSSIIEIVSKATALGLQLNRSDKLAIAHNYDIPEFLRPIVTRNRNLPVEENFRLLKTGLNTNLLHKLCEAIKMPPTCYLSPRPRI